MIKQAHICLDGHDTLKFVIRQDFDFLLRHEL